MTTLAPRIGFLICLAIATAPAFLVEPSIIEASSSLKPSAVNTAPLPALKFGSSSNTIMAAVTASIALPPFSSTAWPAKSAFFIGSSRTLNSSLVSSSPLVPPCMTMTGLNLSSAFKSEPANKATPAATKTAFENASFIRSPLKKFDKS